MKKVFVLDTNILLSDPNSVFKFDDNDVVIPISVIEEIDLFKKKQSETGRNAREVSRIIDELRLRGSLSKGIPLFKDKKDSGLLSVHLAPDIGLLPKILKDNTDNHILSVGLSLRNSLGDTRKVSIITKDINLRIKADICGISSEDFSADKLDTSSLYTGMRRVLVATDAINDLYVNKKLRLDIELFPHEFVLLYADADESQYVLTSYDPEDKFVKLLDFYQDSIWGVYPRNLEQKLALSALLDDRIKLVTLAGGAGTGKTLLAIASGLSKTTDEDIYQKLLVARPIFALGKEIGFLPGDLDEKLNPWMQPIYDSLDFLLSGGVSPRQKRLNKSYQDLIDQGMLAVEPITYIRGRSLPHAYFVVDEAQNLTPHEIKTILTRAGDGTKVVLTGDPYQIDSPYMDSTNNGLVYVIERFKESGISAHISLKHGERSQLASAASHLL